MGKFIRVEYDREYCGGDYKGTGEFVLVPAGPGVEEAFERITGLSSLRIIHFSPDEMYNSKGNLIEGDKKGGARKPK